MEKKTMFTNRFNFKANYITFLSEKKPFSSHKTCRKTLKLLSKKFLNAEGTIRLTSTGDSQGNLTFRLKTLLIGFLIKTQNHKKLTTKFNFPLSIVLHHSY